MNCQLQPTEFFGCCGFTESQGMDQGKLIGKMAALFEDIFHACNPLCITLYSVLLPLEYSSRKKSPNATTWSHNIYFFSNHSSNRPLVFIAFRLAITKRIPKKTANLQRIHFSQRFDHYHKAKLEKCS